MLTCKETSRLVSEGLDHKLSLWQRVNLWLHLTMCGACSAYRKQVETLNRLIQQRFKMSEVEPPDSAGPHCPDDAKQRISESLRERLK